MYPRKRLALGWGELLASAARCAAPLDEAACARAVEAQWSPGGDALCCLSVRSGFDLALQAARLPAGSEVLISAITIPHMLKLIALHGLVAVPVAPELDTLHVSAQALEAAITGRTRAIVVAHLFGSRMPLDAIAKLAHRHGLLLFEDAAQAFTGDAYRGHDGADVSMFSFGTIKTCTALGGGLLRVRDPELLERMRALQRAYPVQPTAAYARKVAQVSALHWVSVSPVRYGALARVARALGHDHDALVMRATRGFPGDELLVALRHRPCAALMSSLHRRLRRCAHAPVVARARAGAQLREALSGAVVMPGARAPDHTAWLFPIVAREPDALRATLASAGFDAARASSSLTCAEGTAGPCAAAMRDILYLPLDAAMPRHALEQMAALVRAHHPQPRADARVEPGADDADP